MLVYPAKCIALPKLPKALSSHIPTWLDEMATAPPLTAWLLEKVVLV